MSVVYMDVQGDSGTNQWSLLPDDHGAHAHYLHVNDGVRDPAMGDGETLTTPTDGVAELFGLADSVPADAAVSQVVLKYYCKHTVGGSAPTIHADLWIDGGWEGAVDLVTGAGYAWKSATFNGAWTGAEVNSSVAKALSDIPMGGDVFIDAAYAHVTYVGVVPEGSSGMLGCNF